MFFLARDSGDNLYTIGKNVTGTYMFFLTEELAIYDVMRLSDSVLAQVKDDFKHMRLTTQELPVLFRLGFTPA